MTEKTPFQLMREKQQHIIEKQKIDAENRAIAFQKGIEFLNQQDLNEKTEALAKQRLVIAEKRKAIVEEKEQERKRKLEQRKVQNSVNKTNLSYDLNIYNSHVVDSYFNTQPEHCSRSSSSFDNSNSSYSSDSSSSSSDSSSSSSSCD